MSDTFAFVENDRLNQVQSRAVMICTPVARDPVYEYTMSMIETTGLLWRLGIKHGVAFRVGNSNLPRVRNELVAQFLASDFDDLLFIDDDMGWKANDVIRLLASDKMIIGGVGRMRVDKPNSDPSVWCGRFKADENRALTVDEHNNVRMEMIGTGFMRIKREAFTQLLAPRTGAEAIWKLPALPHQSKEEADNYWRFFRFGNPAIGEREGEDYGFCEMWTDIGGEIWADPDIELTHVGRKAYTGAISAVLDATA